MSAGNEMSTPSDPTLPGSLANLLADCAAKRSIEFSAVVPHNFVLGEGARLVAIAIAMYNTCGGVLLFGASDHVFREMGPTERFNGDVFAWVINNWTGHSVPFVCATYPHPVRPEDSIEIVLVPPRQASALLRLKQGFASFPAGAVLLWAEQSVLQARAQHFDLLCAPQGDAPANAAVRARGLPPRPPEPWTLVGRDAEMIDLLQWFTDRNSRRLFLDGPTGVGKTTLAAEFGRRLATAGHGLVLPGGARLDHVLYLGRSDPEFSAWAASHGVLMDDREVAQFARILFLAGWFAGDRRVGDGAWLEIQLRLFLASSVGLIILDDGEPANDRILVRVLSAHRHNKLLYTSARQSRGLIDPALRVTGFTQDAEYAAFLGLCAERNGVERVPAADHVAIARWTGGLPRAMEAVVERRRQTPHYADAIKLFRREFAG